MLVNCLGVMAVTGLSECGAEPVMEIEAVAREIVDACLRVHTRVGPGMLESAYEACMVHELGKRGLSVRPHAERHQAAHQRPAAGNRLLLRSAGGAYATKALNLQRLCVR